MGEEVLEFKQRTERMKYYTNRARKKWSRKYNFQVALETACDQHQQSCFSSVVFSCTIAALG